MVHTSSDRLSVLGCAVIALAACDAVAGPGENASDPLISSTDRAQSIAWSGATRELVYGVVAGGEIRAVDYHTGARRVVVERTTAGAAQGHNIRVATGGAFYLFRRVASHAPELRRHSLGADPPHTYALGEYDASLDGGFEVSPDGGSALVVHGAERALTIVDLRTGVGRVLVDDALGNPPAQRLMWWSPDGSVVAAVLGGTGAGTRRAAVVDLTTGTVTEQTLSVPGAPASGTRMQIVWDAAAARAWTPTWIGEAGEALVGIDLRTGMRTDYGRISDTGFLAGTVTISPDGRTVAYWRGQCVETRRSPFGSTSCLKNEVEVLVDRVHGGAARTVYQGSGTGYPALSNVGLPEFSPDGRHLMIARDGGISVLPLF